MTHESKPRLLSRLFKAASPVPLGVWLGLVAAVILDTAVQLVWKQALLSVGDKDGTAQTVLNVVGHPLFWPLLLLCVGQFFVWIILLGNADLSYVMPITGLSYATVAAGAAAIFHEHITPMRMVGIGLILVGVWLTSNTGHRTAATRRPGTAGIPAQTGAK